MVEYMYMMCHAVSGNNVAAEYVPDYNMLVHDTSEYDTSDYNTSEYNTSDYDTLSLDDTKDLAHKLYLNLVRLDESEDLVFLNQGEILLTLINLTHLAS